MRFNLVDCICTPIFILAKILFIFAEALEAPFRLTGLFVYFSYLHFARRIANRRRLQRTGGNAHNIVTSLPSEVNILIFQHMYARKDLGSFLKSNHPSEVCQHAAQFHYRSLHSVALVCRSWNADATIALYESVYLDNTTRLLAFARTLLARPQLCPLVRLIGMPHYMRQFPPHYSTDGPFQYPDILAAKSAVDRVLSQCTNTRHFCLPLSGDRPKTLVRHSGPVEPTSSFVVGLRQALLSQESRVRSLKLQGSSHSTELGSEWDLILPLPEGSDMRHGFQRLTTLIISCADVHHYTLSDPRWSSESEPALPTLRRLVISQYSSISREHFARLLAQTPALESLQMDDVLCDNTRQLNMDIMGSISQCASTLTHLRLTDLHMSFTLGNMDHFVRLQSLVINSEVLFHVQSTFGIPRCQLTTPPPNLAELVIIHSLSLTHTERFNLNPLSLVSAVRDTIACWRVMGNLAPKLRNIELWSVLAPTRKNAWRDWEIGTYILHNLVQPYDIQADTFISYVLSS